MKSSNEPISYREVINNEENLALFLRNMAKFDRDFCDMMTEGRDFTLRLEVRGNAGELIYCRVSKDATDRVNGVDVKVNKKRQQRFSDD